MKSYKLIISGERMNAHPEGSVSQGIPPDGKVSPRNPFGTHRCHHNWCNVVGGHRFVECRYFLVALFVSFSYNEVGEIGFTGELLQKIMRLWG